MIAMRACDPPSPDDVGRSIRPWAGPTDPAYGRFDTRAPARGYLTGGSFVGVPWSSGRCDGAPSRFAPGYGCGAAARRSGGQASFASTTSASTATTPPGDAMTGLRSISRIDGSPTRRSPTAATRAASAPRVDRLGASRAAQQHGAAQALEPAFDLGDRDGRQHDGDVVEHLGQDAAQPDEHGRAEHRVAPAADDQLDPGRGHGLDEQPADRDPRPSGGGAQVGDRRLDRRLVRQRRAPRRRRRSCARATARRA